MCSQSFALEVWGSDTAGLDDGLYRAWSAASGKRAACCGRAELFVSANVLVDILGGYTSTRAPMSNLLVTCRAISCSGCVSYLITSMCNRYFDSCSNVKFSCHMQSNILFRVFSYSITSCINRAVQTWSLMNGMTSVRGTATSCTTVVC